MSRPGFFFCVCPDSELLRSCIEQTIRLAAAPTEKYRRMTFWGDEELSPKFWEALTLQGFEPTLRIIVLRHAQAIPAETFRKLSKALGTPNPQAFCILCLESPWEKGRAKLPAHLDKLPCVSFARKKNWWTETPPRDSRTVRDYTMRMAKEMGLTFAPDALQHICAVLSPSAAAIRGSMEMLALRAETRGDRVLTSADAEILDHVPDFNIFTLIKQLQAGYAAAVWKNAAAESPDDLLFPLLGLLQRESRILWQVLVGESASVNPRDVNERRELARKIGTSGLSRLWDAMHEAELAVKSGRNTPKQALNSLLATVTLLFAPRGR